MPVATVHAGTLTKIDPKVHEGAARWREDLARGSIEAIRWIAFVIVIGCELSRRARSELPRPCLTACTTHAQAERGEAAYSASCIGCHEGQDADGPELTGRAFLDRWREDTLEPLFTFIKTTMPGNCPGSLDDRAYADIIAFILEANGLPAGESELSSDLVGGIQLVGPRTSASIQPHHRSCSGLSQR